MKTILLVALAVLAIPANAAAKLLPFQGYLTTPAGGAVADEARVVQFKIYDAPVAGTAMWAGEVHKLSINKGLVNTVLGSKTSLDAVDFGETLYLEITVDANADHVISEADPPLLPRQIVIPAVFAAEAGDARDLDGHDWDVVFTGGDPVGGKLKPEIIQDDTIPASAIVADDMLQNTQLATDSVRAEEIEDKSITETELSDTLNARLDFGLIPPGTVVSYMGDIAPAGWELCHGQELSRTDPNYAALEAIIGDDRFGLASDPANQFKLPDLRGYFMRGVDGPDGTAADRDPDSGESADDGIDGKRFAMAPGGAKGLEVGSVQNSAIAAHSHNMNAGHNLNANGAFIAGSPGPKSRNQTTDLFGASAETRPKNAYVNYIIKL